MNFKTARTEPRFIFLLLLFFSTFILILLTDIRKTFADRILQFEDTSGTSDLWVCTTDINTPSKIGSEGPASPGIFTITYTAHNGYILYPPYNRNLSGYAPGYTFDFFSCSGYGTSKVTCSSRFTDRPITSPSNFCKTGFTEYYVEACNPNGSLLDGSAKVTVYVTTQDKTDPDISNNYVTVNNWRQTPDQACQPSPSAFTGPSTYCGDGACNGSETCSTCSSDCGVCPAELNCPSCTKNPRPADGTLSCDNDTYGDMECTYTIPTPYESAIEQRDDEKGANRHKLIVYNSDYTTVYDQVEGTPSSNTSITYNLNDLCAENPGKTVTAIFTYHLGYPSACGVITKYKGSEESYCAYNSSWGCNSVWSCMLSCCEWPPNPTETQNNWSLPDSGGTATRTCPSIPTGQCLLDGSGSSKITVSKAKSGPDSLTLEWSQSFTTAQWDSITDLYVITSTDASCVNTADPRIDGYGVAASCLPTTGDLVVASLTTNATTYTRSDLPELNDYFYRVVYTDESGDTVSDTEDTGGTEGSDGTGGESGDSGDSGTNCAWWDWWCRWQNR